MLMIYISHEWRKEESRDQIDTWGFGYRDRVRSRPQERAGHQNAITRALVCASLRTLFLWVCPLHALSTPLLWVCSLHDLEFRKHWWFVSFVPDTTPDVGTIIGKLINVNDLKRLPPKHCTCRVYPDKRKVVKSWAKIEDWEKECCLTTINRINDD